MDAPLPRRAFRFDGIGDYLDLTVEHLFDGADDAKGTVEIRTGSYSATAKHYFSLSELAGFCDQLRQCYDNFSGEASLNNAQGMMELKCTVNRRGHVIVSGFFREHLTSENCLHFEIATDQTQLASAISTLEDIA